MPDNAILLNNGSVPYSPRFGDHYFSTHDGRAEAAQVFVLGNELPEAWSGRSTFKIGELGFGTGLNFLETWRTLDQCDNPPSVLEFTSLEAWPPDREIVWQALRAWPQLAPFRDALLDIWSDLGNGPIALADNVRLDVIVAPVDEALPAFPDRVDAWYLDGFAPARNPGMWSEAVMEDIARRSAEGTTLATFTAAGSVRRGLEAVGFSVVRRPGFGRKRHMTTARYLDQARYPDLD